MKPITELSKIELNALIQNREDIHYSLPVIVALDEDGEEQGEYAIAKGKDEADHAAREYITATLGLFKPAFLADETDLPIEVFQPLCERGDASNNAVEAIIEKTCGMDKFVEDAIKADGRGRFLSFYDGGEIELPCGYIAYRVN